MWGSCTAAGKRYQQRSLRTMALYVVVLLGASWLVRRGVLHGWVLYLYAVLPAVPIIVTIASMGRYLQEETDEFQRVVTMRSLLVGTAALLGTLVVSDFLRSFTPTGVLPPFVSFVLFCVAFGVAQLVQRIQNRPVADDDESAA